MNRGSGGRRDVFWAICALRPEARSDRESTKTWVLEGVGSSGMLGFSSDQLQFQQGKHKILHGTVPACQLRWPKMQKGKVITRQQERQAQ